jgi:hypothetical protein
MEVVEGLQRLSSAQRQAFLQLCADQILTIQVNKYARDHLALTRLILLVAIAQVGVILKRRDQAG